MTTIEIGRYETRVVWPDRADIECRKSGQDWLLRLGALHHWGEVDNLIHLQHLITARLCEGGYADECATPERLAKDGGAA